MSTNSNLRRDPDAEQQIDSWLRTGTVPSRKELHTLSPEQVAASRSRRLCICGHREMFHTVPLGDESRECSGGPEVTDWDLVTGEEVVVDGGGCDCEHFRPAPEGMEVVPGWRR